MEIDVFWKALQLMLILTVPYLCQQWSKAGRWGLWLSPVVLCYGIGIGIANLHLWPIDEALSHQISEITILLAVPLLLYSTDLKKWLRHARSTILSFTSCVVAGLISSFSVALLFGHWLEDSWQYSGMIAGVYTGGIPNVQAIGLAIGAPEERLVLLYAADVFCGGVYLLFLTSVAARIFASFLPSFPGISHREAAIEASPTYTASKFIGATKAMLWTLLVAGCSVGLSQLVLGRLDGTVIILLLTSLSVGSSFFPFSKSFSGAYELGDYCLLMFCIAIGLLSDFATIWNEGGIVIAYMGLILLLTVSLHLFFCYLMKIDRDTVMITSTAALYGPAFIGQVASVIGNRELIFSGIATGLVGLAIGNYVGIGVAYTLKYLLAP